MYLLIFWEKKITKILKRLHKNFDASTANFFFFELGIEFWQFFLEEFNHKQPSSLPYVVY